MSLEKEKNNESSGLEDLKYVAVKLDNVKLAGLPDFNGFDDAPTGAWNEANGVILFKTEEGETFATPANSKTRESINNSCLAYTESLGVPNLNNLDVWGDEERRSQMESVNEWMELSSKSQEFERNKEQE